jgi:hypothetical protein
MEISLTIHISTNTLLQIQEYTNVDLDTLYPCKECTYEEALLINCNIMKQLLFRDTLDCSFEFSAKNPPTNPSKHVNVDKENLQCTP